MRSLLLFLFIVSSSAGAKTLECEGPKLFGWKSRADITEFDLLNLEMAKKGCATRNGGRNPCLKEFHKKTPTSKFKTDYYAVCGLQKPQVI